MAEGLHENHIARGYVCLQLFFTGGTWLYTAATLVISALIINHVEYLQYSLMTEFALHSAVMSTLYHCSDGGTKFRDEVSAVLQTRKYDFFKNLDFKWKWP
jgi:hypothetical protein